VRLGGGTPRLVECSAAQGFRMRPEQLEAALAGGKAKAVVINSPSNPTGAMYSRDELRALGDVLACHPRVWVISDEIYDRVVLGAKPFTSFLAACPELADRTVTVNGLSKSASMTGWRLGWAVAPADCAQAIITLQGQTTSGISALTQWAGVAVLDRPEAEYAAEAAVYRRRRDLMLKILGKAGKLELTTPEGAFYAFVGVGGYLREREDSIAFAERLLAEAKVATVPGAFFGSPHHLRLSFATDDREIQEGCERLVRHLEG
jgi:aspartate aminotransferase